MSAIPGISPVEIQALFQTAEDFRTTRFLTVAAYFVLVYDVLITFDDEVDLVWGARWTMGKTLYFLNRYPVLFEGLLWVVYIINVDLGLNFCKVATHLDNWMTFACVVPAQIILIMRTFAIWERRRWVFVVLVSALVIADLVIVAAMTMVTKMFVFAPQPFLQPILGCQNGLQFPPLWAVLPAWVALMLFDTLIFGLTLFRIVVDGSPSTKRNRLIKVLFRDGLVYYLIVLASSVMNVVVYTALPPGRRGLIDAFVFILRASTSIVASRIVLNLRGILTRPGRRGGGGLWVFKQRQKKQRGGFGLGKSSESSGVADSEGGWGMNRLGKGRDVMTMTMTMSEESDFNESRTTFSEVKFPPRQYSRAHPHNYYGSPPGRARNINWDTDLDYPTQTQTQTTSAGMSTGVGEWRHESNLGGGRTDGYHAGHAGYARDIEIEKDIGLQSLDRDFDVLQSATTVHSSSRLLPIPDTTAQSTHLDREEIDPTRVGMAV